MSTDAPNTLRGLLASTTARGIGLALGIQIVGTVLNFLSQAFLANVLEPSGYGEYALAMSFATLLAVPATLGLNQSAMVFVPKYLAEDSLGQAWGFFRYGAGTVAGLSVLVSLVSSAAIVAFIDTPDRLYLVIGSWLIVPIALLALTSSVARGLGLVNAAMALQLVVTPGLLLSGAVIAVSAFTLDAVRALALTGASTATAVVAVLLLSWWRLRSVSSAHHRPEVSSRSLWHRVGWPLLLSSLFLTVMNQSDVLMLGWFLGTEEAGQYSMAAKTARLISFVLAAAGAYAAPRISRLNATNEASRLQSLLLQTSHLVFWPSALAAIGVLFFADWIVLFYGEGFASASLPLRILVIGHLVNAATGLVALLLELTGYQRDTAITRGIGTAMNVGLNLVLIPTLGMPGAAIATMASMVFWNARLYWIVRRRLALRPSFLSPPL